MRESHFSEAPIIGMITEQEAGLPTSERCRKLGPSPAETRASRAPVCTTSGAFTTRRPP